MCRYRLRLHSEVIIWRCLSTNGSPFVRRKSGHDVQHNAHAQKTKNYANLKRRIENKTLKHECNGELWSRKCLIFYLIIGRTTLNGEFAFVRFVCELNTSLPAYKYIS